MNREIKFRAWDKEKKQMIYDFDQNIAKKGYPVKLGESIHNMVYNIGLGYGTLMQYTGLKDKNGIEIYESDIVIFRGKPLEVKHDSYIEALEGYCPVDGHNAHGWFMVDLEEKNIKSLLTSWSMPVMKELKIIGNIYEHPHILNQNI